MKTSFTGKQFELTPAIKEALQKAVHSLTIYNLEILSADFVIESKQTEKENPYRIEFILNIKQKGTIAIEHKDIDLYAGIDKATEKAKTVLRRHHDKIVDKHKT